MSEITFQALTPGTETDASEVRTGPSGMVIGIGQAGPVTLRLFRLQPTRIFMSTPEYVTWLLAFRAMCLGAHLSVIVEDHRKWLSLADTIRACGGTIDLLRGPENLPGQGRPYRPSLVIDGMGAVSAVVLGFGFFFVNQKLRPASPDGPYGVLAIGISAFQRLRSSRT